MRINATKSACIRFGPRYDADCANLTMKNGQAISWVTTCRYLGVYFVSGRELKCCFDQAKQNFFSFILVVVNFIAEDCSILVVLFFFFSVHRFVDVPGPIFAKLCHSTRYVLKQSISYRMFIRASPLTNLRGENPQFLPIFGPQIDTSCPAIP